MPLNAKGQKVKRKLRAEYGKEHGDRIFYALENSRKLNGIKKRK